MKMIKLRLYGQYPRTITTSEKRVKAATNVSQCGYLFTNNSLFKNIFSIF